MGYHFTDGLVVGDDARWRWIDAEANGFAIDLDLVSILNALADVGRFIVDGNPPLQNQLLHLQTRPQPCLRQHLMQLGRFNLGQQNPFHGHDICIGFIRIELPGNHIGKLIALDCLTLGPPPPVGALFITRSLGLFSAVRLSVFGTTLQVLRRARPN